MAKFVFPFLLVPLVPVLTGCALQPPMLQPVRVPVFVRTYDSSEAFHRLYDVPCSLSMDGNVDRAFVGVKTISGQTDVGPEYPIEAIVRTEFESVINRNFKPVTGDVQPKVELRVHIQRTLLTQNGDEYRFAFVITVQLLDPRHIVQPYFEKIYSSTAISYQNESFIVPPCVYEAVQRVAAEFIADLDSDLTLITTLDRLTP